MRRSLQKRNRARAWLGKLRPFSVAVSLLKMVLGKAAPVILV